MGMGQGLSDDQATGLRRLEAEVPDGPYRLDIDETWTGRIFTRGGSVETHLGDPETLGLMRYLCAAGSLAPALLDERDALRAEVEQARATETRLAGMLRAAEREAEVQRKAREDHEREIERLTRERDAVVEANERLAVAADRREAEVERLRRVEAVLIAVRALHAAKRAHGQAIAAYQAGGADRRDETEIALTAARSRLSRAEADLPPYSPEKFA